MLKQTDLSRVDLNLLTLFDVVMEERHVGRAAARLNLTPSAISHGLGRLRRLLDDPLFLRTPKGVTPSARAADIAGPIADALARVREIVGTAGPFDPATSRRRFAIAAPDAVSAVVLPPLLLALSNSAPHIDVSVRQLLPPQGAGGPERAWASALADLETRAIDVALAPLTDVPARFIATKFYPEDFVIAARVGHAYAKSPTLARFCASSHLLVSQSGDARGFVDIALAERGLARRVALTAPNFMMALAIVATSELIAAVPRELMATHARQFGVIAVKPPFPLPSDDIHAIATRAATMDAGVAWFLSVLLAAGKKPRV